MRCMDHAREACEARLPGLAEELADVPHAVLEAPGGPGLDAFRRAGGPGLLIPAAYGGAGVSAVEAVRITRALGALSPSLGVASAMHNFSVAGLVALVGSADASGLEWMLIEGIARDRLLVASGFAEGRAGAGILESAVTARPAEGGYVIDGSKKPCSLSRSMDLLTASVALTEEDGGTRLGVALIPAKSAGISRRPFWGTPVLAGAESDELVLENVHVADELMLRPQVELGAGLDTLQTVGFVWFELLVTAAYTGAVARLAQSAVRAGRGSAGDRAALVVKAEAAAALTENVARTVDTGTVGNDELGAALTARYAVQDLLVDLADRAAELLGGLAFVTSPEVGQLLAVSRALAFHPPSRLGVAQALLDHHDGAPLLVR
ncbi:acyl-CoA dehydrogenase family protein [Streptomyces griseoflavus]|uniref:acyl-CoA dehydrogenase family protein n=1 Tax=Streptomyces griseoflavus TaxID=35619 RepID=UPI00167D5B5D|nr:acyl-CoA dehydrogenase family protein [Streptomyces griseoflavus]GGV28923.1 putative oxidoreductase [Streptomyces griseoflavus]